VVIHFDLFSSPLGAGAIAWTERGVVGLQLPEANPAATRRRLAARYPGAEEGAPTAEAERAIAVAQAILRGEAVDVASVVFDFDGLPRPLSPFERRVYELALSIPRGSTWTYGEIAARLGELGALQSDVGAARAVGQALGRNPFAPIVPCHRVVAAGGKSGGFSAFGGVATKHRLLALEGARTGDLFAAGPEVDR
jgi:methylated-DNA-[protein]-cysteine S-methyltransferase